MTVLCTLGEEIVPSVNQCSSAHWEVHVSVGICCLTCGHHVNCRFCCSPQQFFASCLLLVGECFDFCFYSGWFCFLKINYFILLVLLLFEFRGVLNFGQRFC